MVLLLLVLIVLILISKDSIFKMFVNDEANVLDSKGILSEEYKIGFVSKRKVYIDVLDTDIKILFDKHVDKIIIETKCLSENFNYNVTSKDDIIRILRGNRKNYNQPGNSGKVLIRLPKGCSLDEINILVTNGDVEIYDINSQKLVIKSDNGILRIDSLFVGDLDIFKLHGDVYLSHVELVNLKLNIEDGNGDFIDVYGEDIYANVINGDFVFANVCRNDYQIGSLKVKTLNGKQRVNVNANMVSE